MLTLSLSLSLTLSLSLSLNLSLSLSLSLTRSLTLILTLILTGEDEDAAEEDRSGDAVVEADVDELRRHLEVAEDQQEDEEVVD